MYAFVTGASRGIGAAIADRLAADGFDLVLNFRSRVAEAEAVANAIRARGRTAELLPFDVADRLTARTALTAMIERLGTPQVVVLNAGVTRDAILGMMGDEDWDVVLGTGLGGFYNILRPLCGTTRPVLRNRCAATASPQRATTAHWLSQA